MLHLIYKLPGDCCNTNSDTRHLITRKQGPYLESFHGNRVWVSLDPAGHQEVGRRPRDLFSWGDESFLCSVTLNHGIGRLTQTVSGSSNHLGLYSIENKAQISVETVLYSMFCTKIKLKLMPGIGKKKNQWNCTLNYLSVSANIQKHSWLLTIEKIIWYWNFSEVFWTVWNIAL